jgi:hypothetical protein
MLIKRLDEMELGPTPAEESCQQLGSDNYAVDAKKECRVYIEFLQRLFPIPEHLEESLMFKIKSCPHDYGDYYDVMIKFDSEIPEAVDFAYNVEANLPGEWDDIAREKLRTLGLLTEETETEDSSDDE